MLANIILGVKDAGADIVGVYRYEQTCTSRLKLLLQDFFKPAPEVTLIKELKLSQIRINSANSELFQRLLVRLNIDLLIVGTWKEKILPETFNIPKIATVNVHPSLLPRYRGPNPYLQTILNGETESGITLHLMNEKFDAGAILKQKPIKIYENDTSKELRERTFREARTLVRELLEDLNSKILTPVNQDERYASYFPNITGEEMMLSFEDQTSDEISRTIRALHPFLPCYITHKDKFFKVDPYKFKILDISTGNAGDIIAKNPQKASITIVCKDKKAIVFWGLSLYKSRFVKRYIKNKVTLD
jgi:methionyl-tRNA formyltransferase